MDICIICKSSKKDDIQYGEFLKNDDFGVHMFCLYLSSNLLQNGDDDEGFLGFLTNDIRAEVIRISALKCCYCYKKYASIGCCEKKCRRTFHLICGLENKAENRFCKDFRSYCHKHARKYPERPSAGETCLICFDSLCAPGKKFNRVQMLIAPCCRNGWFHKLCLQRFAKTAGYFFKCPLCNDSKVFREKLPAKGIFIPNQDAAWELEPDAFAELLERPSVCAAPRCNNKEGRKSESDKNPFIMCHTCGSIAFHKFCLPNGSSRFNCNDCSVALEERDSGHESLNLHANQHDDEYVEVCHVSDKEDLEIINVLSSTNGKISENKRDSGMTSDTDISDDESPLTMKKYRQFKDNEEEKSTSDTDTDDDIKPCASKKTLRLSLESGSSVASQNIKRRTESSSSGEIINRYRLKTRRILDESDESFDSDFTDTELKQTKSSLFNNEYRKSNKKVRTESSSSGEIINRYRLKNRRIFDESDKNVDSELEKTKSLLLNNKNLRSNIIHSESSDQEEIVKPIRKRRRFNNFSDPDEEVISPYQKCLNSEHVGKDIQNSSHRVVTADESDDDTDPLEYFCETKEKKKENCIAKQSGSFCTDKMVTGNKLFDTGNKCNRTENEPSECKKKRAFVGTEKKSTPSKKENNLDMSCIALRTRRRTFSGIENKGNDNLFDGSSIALKTRRGTICGRTDFNNQTESKSSKISEYRVSSPVYERLHESNASIVSLTDVDGSSDLDICADYKKCNSKFDISCIANRTRRRKSSQCQRLPSINEISDCSSDSSESWELLSKPNRLGRLCNRRISCSSEEFDTTSTSAVDSSFKLEKYPAQNFISTLKSNNKNPETSNSKHPFNYHHRSNRNRI